MLGIKRSYVTVGVSATITQTLHEEVYIRQNASMDVPGSWSSRLRDRYSTIVSSRSIDIALSFVGGKFSTRHRVRVTEGTEKREIAHFSNIEAINNVSGDQTPHYRLIRRYATVR